MTELPNNDQSFIPKRRAIKPPKSSASLQIHLFGLFSYVAFFATLVAVGGAFFYQKHMENQRDAKMQELSRAVNIFSVSDMNEVKEFDYRLQNVQSRINHSVSYASILEAIEDATVDVVQFESLELKRVGDEHYLLTASILTPSFDATIFQRSVFTKNDVISDVTIKDFTAEVADSSGSGSAGGGNSDSQSSVKRVVFDAELTVPLDMVSFKGPRINTVDTDNPSE